MLEYLEHYLQWMAGLFDWADLRHRLWVATVIGLSFFVVIYTIERFYGAPAARYRSRNFMHDVAYWFFVRTGLNSALFSGAFLLWVAPRLPQLNINLLGNLPSWGRYITYFLLMEMAGYWYHRWKHHNRFLWAFHAVHHSQEQLTFATQVRFHVLDDFINTLVVFAPLLALGAAPSDWRVVVYGRLFLEAMQHSEIPWRFGPLYKLVVSPVFHSFHHSVKPEHYNRNFGNLLSVWDFMFGTAVDEKERPAEYGLRDIKMPTLWSQLVMPFVIVWRTYFGHKDEIADSAVERSQIAGENRL